MTFLEVDGRFKVLPCRWLQGLFCLLLTSQTPLTSVRSIRAEPGHLRSPSDFESANLVVSFFCSRRTDESGTTIVAMLVFVAVDGRTRLFFRHGVYRNVEWSCLSKVKAMTCAWKLLKEPGMAVQSFSLSLCSLSVFLSFFFYEGRQKTQRLALCQC